MGVQRVGVPPLSKSETLGETPSRPVGRTIEKRNPGALGEPLKNDPPGPLGKPLKRNPSRPVGRTIEKRTPRARWADQY